MCVYSAVMDHYGHKPWPNLDPFVPNPHPLDPYLPNPNPGLTPASISFDPEDFIVDGKTIREWKKQIAEFKEAAQAAKVVDRLTAQPDCEDPEKMKLVDRVRLLEKRLNEMADRVGV